MYRTGVYAQVRDVTKIEEAFKNSLIIHKEKTKEINV